MRHVNRLALALITVLIAAGLHAAPASAATMYGSVTNTYTKKYELSYTVLDTSRSDDGDITISNVKNGYHVRVIYEVYAQGGWNKFLDRYAYDGTTSKWPTGQAPAGAKVRLIMGFYDSNFVKRGDTVFRYGINSTGY